MAQVLYINPNPASQARATTLGCGWMPAVPAQFQSIAEAPCVILNGCGRQVVLADDGTLTHEQVMADLQPMLDEEQAAADVQAEQPVTVDPEALAALLVRAQTATTVAQTRSVISALIQQLTPDV